MSCPVFISYCRDASAEHAKALAARLSDQAFLDTQAIEDGGDFPQHLIDGLLDASIVVIFATKKYWESRFCQLEMRLALAGGGDTVVVARGEEWGEVRDAMPSAVASQNWPASGETDRLAALVNLRLSTRPPAIRHRLTRTRHEGSRRHSLRMRSCRKPSRSTASFCSLVFRVHLQSIGAHFVGRADLLREIHRVLAGGGSTAARLASRIAAGSGYGKTRVSIEYLHRYGPHYYSGGIFWVNAASESIEGEFWRVLSALDPSVPDLAVMSEQKRDVRRELELALRKIEQPALYVIDNIPEAGPGKDPPGIAEFCPAVVLSRSSPPRGKIPGKNK